MGATMTRNLLFLVWLEVPVNCSVFQVTSRAWHPWVFETSACQRLLKVEDRILTIITMK
jgi:hypothetical protein